MKWHFFWIIAIVWMGCAPPKTAILFPSAPHAEAVSIRDRYALLLILDGAQPDVIQELVQAGKLPTIKRLFFENGAVFTHATTVYPTLSIPGHQAIVTGLFPGNHGTPDLTWLDRSTMTAIDYLGLKGYRRVNSDLINHHSFYSNGWGDTPHTLFSALRGHPSLSSYEIVFHGATEIYPHLMAGAIWNAVIADRPEALDAQALGTAADRWENAPHFPRLTVISCYGLDELSHHVTGRGARVLALYEAIDRALADFETIAKKKGILDRMTWVISSDHGQHVTGNKVLDLHGLFRHWGFRIEDDRLLRKRTVHVSARSVSNAQIYLRNGHWKNIPSFAELTALTLPADPSRFLIPSLAEADGVGILLLRKDEHTVRLIRGRDAADIVSLRYGDTDWLSYRPLTPTGDPLDYSSHTSMTGKWVPGKFYPSSYWQNVSKESPHPDALQALAQLFYGPEAGDIVLITQAAYSIRSAKSSNHGSIEQSDLRVPLLLSGPDIRPGRYDIARVVDIYPTLLAIFGIKENSALHDGRLLLEALAPTFTENDPPKNDPSTPDTCHTESGDIPLIELAFMEDPPRSALETPPLKTHESFFACEENRLSRALTHMNTVYRLLTEQKLANERHAIKKTRLLFALEWEKARVEKRLARLHRIRHYLAKSGV